MGRIVKRLHFLSGHFHPFSFAFIHIHPLSSISTAFIPFQPFLSIFTHFQPLSYSFIYFQQLSFIVTWSHFFSFFQMRLKGTLESLNLYEFPKKKTPNEVWPPIASSDWWDVQKLKWNCKLSLSTYIDKQNLIKNFHLIEIFILSKYLIEISLLI